MKNKYKKWRDSLSRMQIIALGFFLIIMTGTLLLMLPISSRAGTWTGFWDSLFTATSATCVTGLVMVDTYVHWNLFGQLVILTMIQIGGLGFMTVGVLFSLVIHRKIGLRERGVLSESVNAIQIGGIVHLVKKILMGTLIIEGTGALLLSIRFCGELGFARGIYYGIFHSISAFCNAGFDLMGYQGEFSSLVNYSGDWLVNLTIMSLVIIGGIGFLVWDDLTQKKFRFRKYRVHTKIVLITTFILVFGGALLFYLFESGNLARGMGPGETFLTCMFDSVTPRTAGFNTTDIAQLSDSSKLLSIILMFIGGSPGSTAGGIKTTTFVVFLLYVRANIKRTRGVNIFRRRIDEDAIKKASAVACTNLVLALSAALLICGVQGMDLRDVLLETFSAISTVGMSTGITRDFVTVSKAAVIVLMYCGRVGSLSMALSFTEKKKMSPVELPEEKILIG
ncbi:MAG: TrkH family potassium uptake protein [Lachnospiraceae bacterium]|jgi:trk system potassium uptake protein TrkH|nr:TrkH family potassium uptake protein [Lachnospiraceae bacterium]